MTNEELLWLAGWLEGEGTFYAWFPKKNNLRRSPAVRIESFSTDYDVVQKACAIAGAFSAPAVDLMQQLLPHMGVRRSEQINKCLDAWDSRLNRPQVVKCACPCGR